MKHLSAIAVLTTFLLLSGCADYAVFGTGTSIGINADTNTQTLNIGFDRAELFTGPAYPDTGGALDSASYFGSNLSAFTPKINQLYATGDAARLATQFTPPSQDAEQPEPFYGKRRPFIFGTGSNVGLKLGFSNGTPVPSSMKFGYNREEISLIPLQAADPAKQTPDKYASVLASVNMDLSSPSLASNEANCRAILEAHGHTYVETLGPFTDSDLIFNTCPPPAQCARLQDTGPKVVIHTTGP